MSCPFGLFRFFLFIGAPAKTKFSWGDGGAPKNARIFGVSVMAYIHYRVSDSV